MQRRGDFLAEQQDRRHRLVGPGIARGQVHWAAGCRLRTLEGSQVDGDPLRVALNRPKSMVRSPKHCTAGADSESDARRRTAWMGATSSRGLNGLVTSVVTCYERRRAKRATETKLAC